MAAEGARSRLARAFRDAGRGLASTYRQEPTFRAQAWIGAAALALACYLGEGVVVVLAFGALVLAFELLNTALERLADVVHPDRHPGVGAAKDAAAAAVVVVSGAALAAGLVVLGPPLVQRLWGAA